MRHTRLIALLQVMVLAALLPAVAAAQGTRLVVFEPFLTPT